MAEPRIVYAPRLDVPEHVQALVVIYRRAIERYEEAKAAGAIGGEGDAHPHRRLRTTKEVKLGTS